MALYTSQWKADSNTQISPRNPGIITVQGNTGGTTYIGGSASGDDLTLKSTSNATKGMLNLDDQTVLWPSIGTQSATIDLFSFTPTFVMNGSGTTTNAINFSPTANMAGNEVYNLFIGSGSYTATSAPGFGSWTFFKASPTLNSSTTSVPPYTAIIYSNNAVVNANTNNVGNHPGAFGYQDSPTISTTSSGTMTVTEINGFTTGATLSQAASTTLTVTTRRGMRVGDVVKSGTPALTDNVGIDFLNLTGGTNNYGIRSAISSGANKFFINAIGTAASFFGGLFSAYNNINTVSNGIPAEYATVDLTAQGGTIGTTTLYTTPTASSTALMYRISWVATVTRTASVSCILGGTNGFQVRYTDFDTGAVKTMPGTVVAGLSSNSNNSLTTGTISGCYVCYVATGSTIQYQMDYTSVGATTMQYNLHIKAEAM